MPYITKNGITIDSEEELLSRASNLGLSVEQFKADYIGPGNDEVNDKEEDESDEQDIDLTAGQVAANRYGDNFILISF